MTLEERIEAAAKRACMYDWETATATERGLLKIQAASWFKYLCPEFFTVPPTGWIAPVGRDVRAFAQAVQHGDEAHRKWLLNAAEDFLDGRPVVPVTP